VWTLPTVVVTSVLAWRLRNVALGLVTAVGLALMVWTPIDLLPEHHEAAASWWRQLLGGSYVWWAVAVIAVAGATVTERRGGSVSRRPIREAGRATDPSNHQLHRL